MANNIQSNIYPQSFNDETSQLEACLHANLLEISTWIPAEVMQHSKDIGGIPYYDVRPLIYDVTNDNKSVTNETIYNVPIAIIGNKNAYIKNEYKKGDKVKVDVCARDIGLIKDTWGYGNSQGNMLFSLAGSIISGYLSVSAPSNYIDLTQDDVIFLKAIKKFIVEAAEETNIESSKVNIGKGILQGVLLEGSLTVVSGTLNLSGLATPDCQATVGTGTLIISNGSKTVKATA